jgi:predicted AlkP superfamily pyrophosphatase or phosphodiesterase
MKRIIFSMIAVCAVITAMAAGRDTYTVIVSLDAFRWDYSEAYDTPFFDYIASEGTKAVMMPSFPSKTFPNHYTLATGLYPDHHGIVANSFKDRAHGKVYSLGDSVTRSDPSYYGGDPIWLTAKHQGVKTATVYWVGSDVAIEGEHANYWKDYLKDRLTFEQRIDEVVNLLSKPQSSRPHLVMAYFEEPDHSGHGFGPISQPTRHAVETLDSLLCVMWNKIQALPIGGKVNLIVTGDHGMAWLSPERTISIKKYIKDEWVDRIESDLPVLVYFKKPEYADSVVNALRGVDHLRAWKRADIPAYLHYGSNPNIGDVVVLPDVGWMFTDKAIKPNTGTHGFDNTCSDMLVGFRAIGPDFKKAYAKGSTFRNVDIYPLLAHLLGVNPSPNDGDLNEVLDMLK